MIKKHLKNSILIFLTFILLFLLNCTTYASSNIIDINLQDVSTNCPSCILIDAKTSEILYSKDAYKKMYPASTTKLMTAILALEKCNLNDIVTVSHNAIFSIPVGYSHASLKEGEELTVEQLLNVLLIPSANDAAIAIAEHIAGSVEDFSVMMNEKAKEIGCISTNFCNPNGIHDEKHYSCAYDLSLIGKYAMQFSDIMRIAKVKQYTLPRTNKYDKTDRIFNTTNTLLIDQTSKNYYSYATGLKTGYTDAAGSCIIATATKEDMDLLTVILNSESTNSRSEDCKALFEYGFNAYSYITLQQSNNIIEYLTIKDATKETKNLGICVKDDIKVLLKNDSIKEYYDYKIEIKDDLKAPISENSVVGTISYQINDNTYTSDLLASSNVLSSSFETILFRLLIVFLILYILHIALKHTEKRKSNKKRNYMNTNKKKKSRNSKLGKGRFKFTQITDYL